MSASRDRFATQHFAYVLCSKADGLVFSPFALYCLLCTSSCANGKGKPDTRRSREHCGEIKHLYSMYCKSLSIFQFFLMIYTTYRKKKVHAFTAKKITRLDDLFCAQVTFFTVVHDTQISSGCECEHTLCSSPPISKSNISTTAYGSAFFPPFGAVCEEHNYSLWKRVLIGMFRLQPLLVCRWHAWAYL